MNEKDVEAYADTDAGASSVKPELPATETLEDDSSARLSLDEASQSSEPPAIPFVPLTKHAAAKVETGEPKADAATEEVESPSDEERSTAPAPANKQNPLTLIGLFASLGGNVFLLWVTTGQRSRYRALLRRSRERWQPQAPKRCRRLTKKTKRRIGRRSRRKREAIRSGDS